MIPFFPSCPGAWIIKKVTFFTVFELHLYCFMVDFVVRFSNLLLCDIWSSCFYSKWPIHTQTLFTDCHRHCVWCTLCMVYWGLCVQLGTNYIEWTYYLNRMTRCLLAYLFVSEPHALTSCFFPVLHCLSKFYKLWLSEMYLSILIVYLLFYSLNQS